MIIIVITPELRAYECNMSSYSSEWEPGFRVTGYHFEPIHEVEPPEEYLQEALRRRELIPGHGWFFPGDNHPGNSGLMFDRGRWEYVNSNEFSPPNPFNLHKGTWGKIKSLSPTRMAAKAFVYEALEAAIRAKKK